MQQEHKKAVDLVSESTTLHLRHTFWYIFLPFFFYADYPVFLISRLKEDVNKQGQAFLSLFKFGIGQ